MYLTYRQDIDHGNYTKVFDASQYSADIPDTVDWRTSNAVTGIKTQVISVMKPPFVTGCNLFTADSYSEYAKNNVL